MDSYEKFRLFRLKHAEMIGIGTPVYNCRCVIIPITKDTTMTQETKPVPHVHYDKIMEWASDPSAAWQGILVDGYRDIAAGGKPAFSPDKQYRRKPRWYDMEKKWIANGKPPVEYISKIRGGVWATTHDPIWRDSDEYRFKEVSRHAALKAEWEAKGLPDLQFFNSGSWDLAICPSWREDVDYRIKPTPHPDADVLRAIADDISLMAEINGGQYGWGIFDISKARLRINP